MPDPRPKKLTLTPGERWTVHRLRRGHTQTTQAALLGVSLWAYRRVENDQSDAPPPPPAVEPLAEHERLWLRRKRAGVTRAQLARTLHLSEFWVYRMEHGLAPLDALRAHWSKR